MSVPLCLLNKTHKETRKVRPRQQQQPPSSPTHQQDVAPTGNDAERDNSEQNLIRAIQAAQQARGGVTTKSFFVSRASSDEVDVRRTWRMDGPPTGNGGDGESTAAAVLALQLVWMGLEAASEALLPLWMLSPGEW